MCGSSSCDYVKVHYGNYNEKITDTGHVVYSASTEFYVDFISDASGTGTGFTASVSYLGESGIYNTCLCFKALRLNLQFLMPWQPLNFLMTADQFEV